MSRSIKTPALAAAITGSLMLAGSAFAATPLVQGYMLGADAHDHAQADAKAGKTGKTSDPKRMAEAKCGADKGASAEGKCGEGKCGDAKKHAKAAEGGCGAKNDAKAAEGSCGASKDAKKDAKAAEGKCGEGKCGEGKCGGAA